MNVQDLNKAFGNIDLYLLDQILKGRFSPSMKILDAGCGEGRNLMYFIQNNYDVSGIDCNPDAIRMLQFVARSSNPALSRDNFLVGNLEAMPYQSNEFDVVICSAVLHFAKSDLHFNKMLAEIVRVSKPGAIIFIRTASSIGIEDKIGVPDNGCYNLPDGSFRFLIHRSHMNEIPALYGLDYVEPFKTVNVADMRCMSNLVLKKL
jgi:ubiquinone/menaquinone biosynthesis C-methylase UbiE